ncbi:hypothetical protein BAE44_0004172, partial [Dichanthelium oligosanthes]
LVKSELARAIPIKWDRVVREHGKNTYIVPFFQVELQRMLEDQNKDMDQEMEDVEKQQNSSGSSSSSATNPKVIDSNQVPTTGAPTALEKQTVGQSIDMAVDMLLEEISLQVIAETDPDVSMGRDNSVISSSVTSIKNIEIDRLKVSARNNSISNKSSSPKINLDEEEEDLIDAHLYHICGDFYEGEHDEGYDHTSCDLIATPRRKKIQF